MEGNSVARIIYYVEFIPVVFMCLARLQLSFVLLSLPHSFITTHPDQRSREGESFSDFLQQTSSGLSAEDYVIGELSLYRELLNNCVSKSKSSYIRSYVCLKMTWIIITLYNSIKVILWDQFEIVQYIKPKDFVVKKLQIVAHTCQNKWPRETNSIV